MDFAIMASVKTRWDPTSATAVPVSPVTTAIWSSTNACPIHAGTMGHALIKSTVTNVSASQVSPVSTVKLRLTSVKLCLATTAQPA